MKINILFVVDNLKLGGVTKVLINLLKKLDTNKYNIDLLVLHYYDDMQIDLPSEISIIKGSKMFSLIDENINSLLKEKNIKKIIKKCLLVFQIKTGIIKNKIIKDRNKNVLRKYDVEIAFGDGFPYFYTAYGNSKKKISWHHSDVLVKDYSSRYYKKLKKALSMMDINIAVSDKVSKAYQIRYELKNIQVVPNIMDVDEILKKSNLNEYLPFDNNQLNFLSVGRLDYSKNYKMLLKVAKRLIDEGYNFKVYIVGDGEEREQLEKSIIDLNMKDNFILLGRKDNPYPYIKNSDMFLLSSRYEGLPTVIIESLILQVPCISTEVAGIKQILNNDYGIITQNNENDFYLGLKDILTNPEKIKIMKNNLSNYKYDNNKIINKIEKILK